MGFSMHMHVYKVMKEGGDSMRFFAKLGVGDTILITYENQYNYLNFLQSCSYQNFLSFHFPTSLNYLK
jgi:hypothetical protein